MTMMTTRSVVVAMVSLLLFQGEYVSTSAFVSQVSSATKTKTTTTSTGTTSATTTQRFMIDPISINVGIAAFSAAAGAASQFPKMQALERELEIAKLALTQVRNFIIKWQKSKNRPGETCPRKAICCSFFVFGDCLSKSTSWFLLLLLLLPPSLLHPQSEREMVNKMKELEDRLFTIDQEYEAQTARFKKQYDVRTQEQLATMKEKIKSDFEFKLDIKLEEEKSKMLQEKLEFINGMGVNKSNELFGLRIKQQSITEANEQLEKALAQSEAELERLRKASSSAATKKKFLFF
jgi:uncharacterized membrane protein